MSGLIWFSCITELTGSEKSTIASVLEFKLNKERKLTYLLDRDNFCHGFNKDLGFTKSNRIENIRRTIEVAKLMVDTG